MHALWDRYPCLPYQGHVPWPRIQYRDHQDWVASVDLVDSWLRTSVGSRWVNWTWGWATFACQDLDQCHVNFRWERDRTLFLLRFGQ